MISVIVPVYNVESYLDSSLRSLVNQTYKDFEVIIVDDGSTDGSSLIGIEYSQKYSNIRYVKKINGGLSSARNFGIKLAKGDFFAFVDGDDRVNKNFLSFMKKKLDLYNADISVCQFNVEVNNSKDTYTKNVFYDKDNAYRILLSNNDIGYSVCNKLFRKELFTEIKFPEGRLMEDMAIMYKLIDSVKNGVFVTSRKLYNYVVRQNGIMHNKFSVKQFDMMQANEEMLNFTSKKYPNFISLAEIKYLNSAAKLIFMMLRSNHHEKYDYDRCVLIIKKYHRTVKHINTVSWKFKFVICSIKIFPDLPFIFSFMPFKRIIIEKLGRIR